MDMDKFIKYLKIIFLTIAIFIGIGVLVGMVFIYKGIKSGDLDGFLTKSAIETFVDDSNLTQEQQKMLESGDYEGLVNDFAGNLTEEQIDCVVEAVGEKRAQELTIAQDPTPQEIFRLSKCL
jgi:hypothetical protein